MNGPQVLRLPGLRLLGRVGAGSLSVVYLAVREADGLPLAVKVMQLGPRVGPTDLARLPRERALLAGIAHPNVIRIHDAGQADDCAWLAMEYFDRGDLRSALREPLAPARALSVVRQLAQALQAIHAAGIVHGDVKPQNVMLRGDGGVVLCDFGIARTLRGPAVAPAAGEERIGTPFYLSPEQARGEPVTPASDLYSLGVMLVEMLAGERPYRAESLGLLLAQHCSAPVPRLPQSLGAWQPLVERLMAKQPEQRYPGAGALLAELERMSHSPA
jgi:serine/threonine protein kinase